MSAILLAQSEEGALNSGAFDTLQFGYRDDSQNFRTLQNFQVFLSDPLLCSFDRIGKLSCLNEFLAGLKNALSP
jgi:hypothetical protein